MAISFPICRTSSWRLAATLVLAASTIGARSGAADIVDGAPAIDALGQYDQTSFTDPQPDFDKSGTDDRPNAYGLETPQGVALDTVQHRLFVSESNNNRVLVYDLDESNRLVDRFPDAVLGQPDLSSGAANSPSRAATTMAQPAGLAVDAGSTHLYVADSGNSRVLVFDITSITSGEAAIAVLGQTDFTSGAVALFQGGMSQPRGVALDESGRRLFVADQGFNRVLVFDITAVTNGEAAINVLGQSTFTSSAAGLSQSALDRPADLAYDGENNRLFVADAFNNRVLAFDLAALSNGEGATHVICQASYGTESTGAGAAECFRPVGVWFDAPRDRLYVSESINNRVHVYSTGATFSEFSLAAVNVLGQPTLGAALFAETSRSRIADPAGLVVNPADGRLYLAENSSNRILIFDAATLSDGEDAEDLIGQYDETSYTSPVPRYTKAAPGNAPNLFGLSGPRAVEIDPVRHRLFVADTLNSRVLMYELDSSNRLIDRIPDAVLGQGDFTTGTSVTTQAGVAGPGGLAWDSTTDRLFVSDTGNNRVLVYDTATVTSGEPAITVLGQGDFTSSGSATAQNRLQSPGGLALDTAGRRLFVADRDNNRVVVFDVAAVTNGENAVNVLGQPDFVTADVNLTAASLTTPRGLAYDSTRQRLFVADTDNSRVLMFDVASITDGESAVKVLCQSDFGSNNSSVSQGECSFPEGVVYDGGLDRLYLFDSDNNRVVVFDTSAVTNGEEATHVIGQVDFDSATPGTSVTAITRPRSGAFDAVNERLYVADAESRVIVFPTDYEAAFSGTTFTEAAGGGGTIATTLTVRLKNELWSVASGPLNRLEHYTIGALPAGLTEVVTVTSPTTATITLTGVASRNTTADSVSGIAFALLNAAFTNVSAADVAGSSTSFAVTFTGAPTPVPTATPTPVPTPCFGGTLDAPKVGAGSSRATVTLSGAKVSSAACVVTIKGQRRNPSRRVSAQLAPGKKKKGFARLLRGKWTFFYTVRTTALGTTSTSRKRAVVVR